MSVTIDDDPVEACYFEQITTDAPGGEKTLRMVRALIKELDDKTNKADLLVMYPDRRLTRTAVPYAPGKPGSWGWPNDK